MDKRAYLSALSFPVLCWTFTLFINVSTSSFTASSLIFSKIAKTTSSNFSPIGAAMLKLFAAKKKEKKRIKYLTNACLSYCLNNNNKKLVNVVYQKRVSVKETQTGFWVKIPNLSPLYFRLRNTLATLDKRAFLSLNLTERTQESRRFNRRRLIPPCYDPKIFHKRVWITNDDIQCKSEEVQDWRVPWLSMYVRVAPSASSCYSKTLWITIAPSLAHFRLASEVRHAKNNNSLLAYF